MPFCGSCGTEVPAGNKFCGGCGKPMPPQQSQSKTCSNCGCEAKPNMFFCESCGHRLDSANGGAAPQPAAQAAYAQQPPVAATAPQAIHAQQPPPPQALPAHWPPKGASHEVELMKFTMGSYYKKVTLPANGTIMITNYKIHFKPMKFGNLLEKERFFPMQDIVHAERASVLAVNLCMRIHMKDGQKHLFNMGLVSGPEIQRAVDAVNTYKGG